MKFNFYFSLINSFFSISWILGVNCLKSNLTKDHLNEDFIYFLKCQKRKYLRNFDSIVCHSLYIGFSLFPFQLREGYPFCYRYSMCDPIKISNITKWPKRWRDSFLVHDILYCYFIFKTGIKCS